MSKKVLIIEDEPAVLDLLETYLEDRGLTVNMARDGFGGLEKIKEDKPDIVVLDLVMPGINGIELCRSLQKDPTTADIPVIISTGICNEDIAQKVKEAGAKDIVKKPYSLDGLFNKIKEYIKSTAVE